MDKMKVRVRFAPSPTGPFHVGNARAALFNWLFARREKGVFLLRIEDTNKERSEKKFERAILDGLRWLELEWDEEPIRQSGRLDVYEKFLRKLLDEGRAYYCFCAAEELEAEKQAQMSQGISPKYGGRCQALSSDKAERRVARGEPAVVRLKMPEKKISFSDSIRGKVEFDTNLLGDIIISKGLREPLYNFTAVVDDAEMEITHVIRGEDHLSNTPKQIVIQEMLGFHRPQYAHLPLLLGPDRKKLSKRYLARAIADYREAGYLPQAMVNFLALLGWHPAEDREVLSREELISEFSLERVQKGGAIFSEEKLQWLNGHYIKTMEMGDLIAALEPSVPKNWLTRRAFFERAVALMRERVKTLIELREALKFLFELPEYAPDLLIWKETPVEVTLENLRMALEVVLRMKDEELTRKSAESKLMLVTEQRGRGEVLWPLRVALSGRQASPGPFELIEALGREEAMRRIKLAVCKLEGVW